MRLPNVLKQVLQLQENDGTWMKIVLWSSLIWFVIIYIVILCSCCFVIVRNHPTWVICTDDWTKQKARSKFMSNKGVQAGCDASFSKALANMKAFPNQVFSLWIETGHFLEASGFICFLTDQMLSCQIKYIVIIILHLSFEVGSWSLWPGALPS